MYGCTHPFPPRPHVGQCPHALQGSGLCEAALSEIIFFLLFSLWPKKVTIFAYPHSVGQLHSRIFITAMTRSHSKSSTYGSGVHRQFGCSGNVGPSPIG